MSDQAQHQRQFSRDLIINAPKDAVWKALSEAIELTQWFSPQATIEQNEGGKIEWQWSEEIAWPQTIREYKAGERLLTAYDFTANNKQVPLFVDFQLQSHDNDNKTSLRLIHSGFGPEADFDGEYDGISSGWVVELRSLQLYLEKHFGKKRQLTWIQGNFSCGSKEAWQTLTSSKGLNCATSLEGLKPGDEFNFTTVAGDTFSGEVFINKERSFVGIVKNWGDSFLRIQVESCGGDDQVWLWHAAYGQPQNKIDGLNQRWQQMVVDLFGPESIASPSALTTTA